MKNDVQPLGFRRDGSPIWPIAGGSGSLAGPGGAVSNHAVATPLDRLVRKEVALGTLREYEPPTAHIGLQLLAPWEEVESDDVIFDYVKGTSTGLAPARAEDAESELAQKDEPGVGYGRAALIDWALKDHYDPSDVSRYREALLLRDSGLAQQGNFPLTVNRMIEGFAEKLARDERSRRLKLDNRIEWMITQALETGGIAYNDGKIQFAVSYGRPAGQVTTAANLWNTTAADPIADILGIKQTMRDTHGVTLDRAITSSRVINTILTSSKFNSAGGGNPYPFYTVQGWGPEAAAELVQQVTGVNFIVYDSVYRTRPLGSNTFTNNRFLSDNKIFFLPSQGDIDALDDAVGFGATLTSPHPEGNWTAGYYEWERETVDPWGLDRGTGVKAFPIFPHLDLTWVLSVL